MSTKKEFGDFQTPTSLANEVVGLIDSLLGAPSKVIEPTAGQGTFLDAAEMKWGRDANYQGFEINPVYVKECQEKFAKRNISITQQDFFLADWKSILSQNNSSERTLLLGNPPWVTNSGLGVMASANLPTKTNFKRMRGFEAKTGSANFDIAEWMIIQLVEYLSPQDALAMLCKTTTARRVLKHLWKTKGGFADSALFRIDAKHHFDVAADACLLFITGKPISKMQAAIYPALSLHNKSADFGLINGNLVSDIAKYNDYRDIDKGSTYTWRSGIKHDAAQIMELRIQDDHYINGLGEEVYIEQDYVYPLLKSSDIANGRITPQRSVIITQTAMGECTQKIKQLAPQTWAYLESHNKQLENRQSSIYKNREKYAIFGIGEYTFSPWKVAISGLYKNSRFVAIPPRDNRPVMVDDTCYFISCQSQDEANLICEFLNSSHCQNFMTSLVFNDSKRPVTSDILRRISLVALAQRLNRTEAILPYLQNCKITEAKHRDQMTLVI
jgi:hypothetical protein